MIYDVRSYGVMPNYAVRNVITIWSNVSCLVCMNLLTDSTKFFEKSLFLPDYAEAKGTGNVLYMFVYSTLRMNEMSIDL